MLFHPQNFVKADGGFLFSGAVDAVAHSCLDKDIIKELWHNFTFQSASLNVRQSDEFVFSVGNAKPISLDGHDYSIHVAPDGVCVYAESKKNLLLGFMTLIDRIKAVDLDDGIGCELECCEIRERALIGRRMVHLCVFPETELWELCRFVRFCAALRYTHIVLEFWGTLQYDCMSELSWRGAFTKEQIRPIIREANDLGLEVIPMFNHWGHASAGRVMHGKHVVLDQNPALQTYFSEDGWCWDIRKPKVRGLLRKIREELTDLCGEGSYFHVGCDEAYNFAFTKENMDFICDFINEVSEEMAQHGRKIIAWGDMFLYRHAHYNPANRYSCNAPTPEVEEYLLGRLSREVILADWQYKAPCAPVETSSVFLKKGFRCLLCPWDMGVEQMVAALSTVKDQALDGLLHTTWHTLTGGMHYVAMAAVGCFEDLGAFGKEQLRTGSAALLRKVMPVHGDYEKAGWSKIQVHSKW